MTRRIELLAPGGDVEAIKAAVAAGAGAVYCGLDKLNARHRAQNISFDDLYAVIALAHQHRCKVFLTLNTVIVQSDLQILIRTLNRLANTNIDGIIVQDLGLLHLLASSFPGLKVHASTQLTTHNPGQLRFLRGLAVTRVNLSRELNLREIEALTREAHDEGLRVEVFVHGSYCLSFSGICYFSSAAGSNSGNRGKCSQPCRDKYVATPMGNQFPMNLRDNSAYYDLEALDHAGVDALKIEGRMKNFHYVYAVTEVYRRRLESLRAGEAPADHSDELHVVFNRGFSDGFLRGEIHKEMFTDNPRNHAADHYREKHHGARDEDRGEETAPFDEIARTAGAVKQIIDGMPMEKLPMAVSVSGAAGAPLEICLEAGDATWSYRTEARLARRSEAHATRRLDRRLFSELFRVVGRSRYYLERLDLEELGGELSLPLNELNAIKKKILSALNESMEVAEPVAVPVFSPRPEPKTGPTLSVLVSSPADLRPCAATGVDLYLQLPNGLAAAYSEYAALLAGDGRVVPWFPSVLMVEDHAAAVRLLRKVRPARIVTNNTGVAHEAHHSGIRWIAGPHLNIANTLSLLCLKERFGCFGAFISNELSRSQIYRIVPPDGMELYYRIFHPMMLLTSRQCLLHQVTGCDRDRVDEACVSQCERSSSITNSRGHPFLLRKTRGNYGSIYHEHHFLNTQVVVDFPRLFNSLFLDLRDIQTRTRVTVDKPELIGLFERHVQGDEEATLRLARCVHPTTKIQYDKGI